MAGVTSYADVTPEVVADVKSAMKSTQLDVAVLGTYVELGELDSKKRQKDVADFISQIPVCKALGASCIASETTYFDDLNPAVSRSEGLKALVTSLEAIMPEAERQGVTVGLEPVWFHTMNTVEVTRQIIDHVKSPMRRYLIWAVDISYRALLIPIFMARVVQDSMRIKMWI